MDDKSCIYAYLVIEALWERFENNTPNKFLKFLLQLINISCRMVGYYRGNWSKLDNDFKNNYNNFLKTKNSVDNSVVKYN